MSLDAAAPAQPFAHQGKFFDVLGLALKNAGLTIVTLTLYRFWARTSMRRRLWSRMWVMGDPLEYTGTGGELLRGFLISLPTFFIPAIFVFYVAPFAMDPVVAAWLSIGFYIFAVPLIAAARYWMRRYQLSRTRWRGIRMGLSGSAWSFAFASAGWTVLQTLSLGWYTPVARMNRAKLLWENARFGDQPFQFVEDGEPMHRGLWGPFALGWFSVLIAYFATITLMAVFVFIPLFGAAARGADGDAVGQAMAPYLIAAGVIGIVVFFALLLLLWAPYNAAAMNRIASLITLDGARFQLRAKTFSLFLVSLAGWAIIIFSLGLLAPMAGFLQVRYILNRLEMIGTPRFAEIGQSIVEEPRAGESLGDAFDLDMGVGVV
jgi:uncharacterized membrane protein YjgN (DUF898 family)